jgi:hypothetical protein
MKFAAAACLCLGVLLVEGCRSGKPQDGPGGAAEDVQEQDGALDPADSEPPEQDPGAGETHGTYLQDIARIEAGRVEAGEALALALSRLKSHGILLDLVKDLSAVGPSRSFKKAGGINESALGRMKETRKGTGDDVLELLNNVARRNLEAYASCMAVAKGDPSWCDAAEKTWKGSGTDCGIVYDIYLLIMGKAYTQTRPCSKIMTEARTMKGEEGVRLCEALVGGDPDACPWDQADPRGAYCAAAAIKGNIRACDKVKIGWEEKKKRCCEIFAWRMSWLPSGSGEIEIPEAGALKGNEAGCLNALRWGLFESLAPLFDVPLEGDHPSFGELGGEFLCPVLVYWTERDMAF